MSQFQARVFVNLRDSVLDPAGEATKSAATRLGINGIERLRIGKAIDLDITASNKEEAKKIVELLTDRLLANPVIESWTFELNSIST